MAEKNAATPITIKKYANRRLYDTTNSRYVNLRQIGALIREGNTVEVIDSTSGEDLTKVILTQIILEEEKEQRNLLPTEFLHRLIQSGESAYEDFLRHFLSTSMSTYRSAQEQMETAFRGWVSPWLELTNAGALREIESLKAKLAELETRLEEPEDSDSE